MYLKMTRELSELFGQGSLESWFMGYSFPKWLVSQVVVEIAGL